MDTAISPADVANLNQAFISSHTVEGPAIVALNQYLSGTLYFSHAITNILGAMTLAETRDAEPVCYDLKELLHGLDM